MHAQVHHHSFIMWLCTIKIERKKKEDNRFKKYIDAVHNGKLNVGGAHPHCSYQPMSRKRIFIFIHLIRIITTEILRWVWGKPAGRIGAVLLTVFCFSGLTLPAHYHKNIECMTHERIGCLSTSASIHITNGSCTATHQHEHQHHYTPHRHQTTFNHKSSAGDQIWALEEVLLHKIHHPHRYYKATVENVKLAIRPPPRFTAGIIDCC